MEEKKNFCSGGEKMRNASGHPGENERLKSEKNNPNRNTHDISSTKRVTQNFYVVVVQNNGKEMYKESVLHGQTPLGITQF